ncbi:MAG: hypothetical protein PHC64_07585 [Candidatus Gastranaerophilales bacterium]|nr:hypothetical protein [Candidatus Gastranaerophilales bacterium]
MKILITIPHYYNPSAGSMHGSGKNNPQIRIYALCSCLFNIYSLFGLSQCMIDIRHKKTVDVNNNYSHSIDVVICTTNGKHLLNQANIPKNFYEQMEVKLENPKFLGFECQKVLKENLGKYDYYCFMEDDLIINDPYFFEKIKWFKGFSHFTNVLQPNRYEVSTCDRVLKSYIDGNINPGATANYQNINENPILSANILGQNILFQRVLNPHSGCYFLTQEQMAHWAEQSHFLDMDTNFISPLESSATLGLMKTFRVYKPSPQNASFLEIQHYGNSFLGLIGKKIALAK